MKSPPRFFHDKFYILPYTGIFAIICHIYAVKGTVVFFFKLIEPDIFINALMSLKECLS